MLKRLKRKLIALCGGMALNAALIVLSMFGMSEHVYAQNCTGTTFACATWDGSRWFTVQGSKATTSFSGTTFTFNNSSTYPMTSDQTIERTSSPPIYLTINRGPTAARNMSFYLEPTNNLIWNAARNGYNVRGYSNDLVLQIEGKVGNGNYTAITGTGSTALSGTQAVDDTWAANGGRGSQNVNFTVRIKAVLYSAFSSSINIPTTTILTMYGPKGSPGTKGDVMGSVNIEGAPAIYIEPPKPKTCDALPANYERVFTLADINVDSLAAGAESTVSDTQSVQLTNCPAGISLTLAVSDAAFPNNTGDYLRNQSGTNYAANAGVRLYYNNTEKVTMTSWRKQVTTTAGTMNLPFTAKYYRLPTGNLGIGVVRSQATVTITYN